MISLFKRLIFCLFPILLSAQTVDLGVAASYAVIGSTTVTNTGPTVINGDLGVTPGSSVTGFPPGIVTGTIHANDAAAISAKAAAQSAYTTAVGLTPMTIISGVLDGLTLTPGIYSIATGASLNGTLTLDGQNLPNATFVFQIGSTLITSSASQILLSNGTIPSNVFWQVGSSATLGTASSFQGNILANTSITATTGVTSVGSLYALNGAVTLDTNTITAAPPPPVLSILKTHLTSPFIVGQQETYTLTVSNTGNGPTDGTTITVTDELPIGLTFVPGSGSGTNWVFNVVGQIVTITTTGVFLPSETAPIITFHVAVDIDAVPGVNNTASITGGGDVNTATSTDSVAVTQIIPEPILTLSKVHTPNSFILGQQGIYTLTVGNAGTITTSGTIIVTDTLPVGLSFVAASGDGWAFNVNGQTVTATTTSPISSGSSAPLISLIVNVNMTDAQILINNAIASGGGASNTPLVNDATPIINSLPNPPTNFRGKTIKNKFLTQTEYIHFLKWRPSNSSFVVTYHLFRNNQLIAEIPRNGPYYYIDHNRHKNKVDTYSLIAIDSNGQQSIPAIITVP
ncbi:MAG: ice-binding family protein [Parachlamydiaceae bacterium]|nr:ice-binding family protein [Parachlamydiaceae bacterium]